MRTCSTRRYSAPSLPVTTSCSASSVSSIGCDRVEPVDLVEVDVVHPQAAERVVYRLEDVLARQAAGVRVRPYRIEHLRRDDDFIALGDVAHRATEHLFADAVRVHVRGVKEVDPVLHAPIG